MSGELTRADLLRAKRMLDECAAKQAAYRRQALVEMHTNTWEGFRFVERTVRGNRHDRRAHEARTRRQGQSA